MMEDSSRIVMRGARGSGKTVEACRWMVEKMRGKRVLVLVRSFAEAEAIRYAIREEFEEEVLAVGRNFVEMGTGTYIRMAIGSDVENARGERYDAIVIDNANNLDKESIMMTMSLAAHRPNFNFFITYSKEEKWLKRQLEGMSNVCPVEFKYSDFLDMVASGLITPKQAREIMASVPEKVFLEEWGPYSEETASGSRNARFLHLLKK